MLLKHFLETNSLCPECNKDLKLCVMSYKRLYASNKGNFEFEVPINNKLHKLNFIIKFILDLDSNKFSLKIDNQDYISIKTFNSIKKHIGNVKQYNIYKSCSFDSYMLNHYTFSSKIKLNLSNCTYSETFDPMLARSFVLDDYACIIHTESKGCFIHYTKKPVNLEYKNTKNLIFDCKEIAKCDINLIDKEYAQNKIDLIVNFR